MIFRSVFSLHKLTLLFRSAMIQKPNRKSITSHNRKTKHAQACKTWRSCARVCVTFHHLCDNARNEFPQCCAAFSKIRNSTEIHLRETSTYNRHSRLLRTQIAHACTMRTIFCWRIMRCTRTLARRSVRNRKKSSARSHFVVFRIGDETKLRPPALWDGRSRCCRLSDYTAIRVCRFCCLSVCPSMESCGTHIYFYFCSN